MNFNSFSTKKKLAKKSRGESAGRLNGSLRASGAFDATRNKLREERGVFQSQHPPHLYSHAALWQRGMKEDPLENVDFSLILLVGVKDSVGASPSSFSSGPRDTAMDHPFAIRATAATVTFIRGWTRETSLFE